MFLVVHLLLKDILGTASRQEPLLLSWHGHHSSLSVRDPFGRCLLSRVSFIQKTPLNCRQAEMFSCFISAKESPQIFMEMQALWGEDYNWQNDLN